MPLRRFINIPPPYRIILSGLEPNKSIAHKCPHSWKTQHPIHTKSIDLIPVSRAVIRLIKARKLKDTQIFDLPKQNSYIHITDKLYEKTVQKMHGQC